MEKGQDRMWKIDRRACACLLLAMAAGMLFIFHDYLFGQQLPAFFDIGSDTAEQYIPLYAMIAGKLRIGDLNFWTWNNGYGMNLFLCNLGNPGLLLVYVLGAIFGPACIPYALLWLYLLEILLAGLFAYAFLSYFDFDEWAKVIAAYLYAFSGFMMVWGQHYQFANLPLLLMLMLIAVERLTADQNKWRFLTVMSFVLILNSMYTAYMALLFAGVYILIRCGIESDGTLRDWIGKWLRFVGPVALGVGLSMLSLLPSAMAISKVTSRLASSDSLFARLFLQLFSGHYFRTLFLRSVSSTSMGINNYAGFLNYYEGPNLFFSTLFLILLPQYLFLLPKMEREKRARRLHYLAFVLVLLSLAHPLIPTVMTAFTGPSLRFHFVLFAYFAIVTAKTMTEIIRHKHLSYAGMLVSLLYMGGAFLYYQMHPELPGYEKIMVLHLVIGIAMLLALYFMVRTMQEKKALLLLTLLCALLVSDVTGDAYSSFVNRVNVRKGSAYFDLFDDADTAEALRYLQTQDGQFYRTEKTYGATNAMDAPAQNYHPVSTYNSTMNKYILDYYLQSWDEMMYADVNHYLYTLGVIREDQATLSGVKYVLSKSNAADIPGMEFYRQFGEVFVYQHPAVDNIASFYTETEVLSSPSGEEGIPQLGYEKRDQSAQISLPEPARSNTISGEVSAASDGLLFLAIPYEAGWELRVDGEAAEMKRVNTGFVGVPMKAGDHVVELKYHPPGLLPGAIISTIVFVIFLFCAWPKRKRKQHAL